MVKAVEKRLKELEETLKVKVRAQIPEQKIITSGYERFSPRGVETTAERQSVICPNCLSENLILPGSTEYKCEICNQTQKVTR